MHWLVHEDETALIVQVHFLRTCTFARHENAHTTKSSFFLPSWSRTRTKQHFSPC